MSAQHIIFSTSLGTVTGNSYGDCNEFLGIPFAKAERFEYAKPVDHWNNPLDATTMGKICPQYRQYYPHYESAERRFYFKEFRKGLEFTYGEDCLNLNIYTPKDPKNCPVILYFHGGGFNSGSNNEEPFRGYGFAKKGVITVFANYRVGILGYLTHEDIQKKYGHDGNFGLDDMVLALRWVKDHIREFGGDPDNITLLGQSAGAISIQYLCLNHNLEGMFTRAAMMSGGGMFPKFALPKLSADTHEYWQSYMKAAGCETLDDLKKLDLKTMFDVLETFKAARKDNTYNTMPVVDGYLIKDRIDLMIKNPLKIGYMIGFTNNDMYAPIMAYIGSKFGKANNAYLYFFDMDAPGDHNAAFHSSDLRYMFERLEQSWRPYTKRDYEASSQLSQYTANFAKTGNPNGPGLPEWKPKKVLCFTKDSTKTGRPNYFKMARNMIKIGDPKDEVQS
ncbi:MAG: carboxylesterase family protein [Erysipelotrichales bacterium]|nr:carboxylesterase family protein [Erysipelotrichales bacterium]